MLRQTDLTIREMCEAVMQNTDPVSTRKATDRMVKMIDSTYTKAELEEVDVAEC